MNNDKRINNAIVLIDSFIFESQNYETFQHNFSKYRDGIYSTFYSNNSMYEIFKEIFPPIKLGEIEGFLRTLSRTAGFNQNDIMQIRNELITLKELILNNKINSKKKIFYSWQSDLPNNTNKSFIQISLEQAIKEINQKFNLSLEMDSDTRGEPGSPDIANTILNKIDNSLACICDVSFVVQNNGKGIPNPNVMFELGYAMKSLGSSNIIMIFNEASGDIRDIPFDLGLKRQLKYYCDKDDEAKADKRKELSKTIYKAIEAIINHSVYVEE